MAKNGTGGMMINIPSKYDRYSQDRGFRLSCGNKISQRAIENSPARLDINTDTWVRDSYNYIYSLNSSLTDDEIRKTDEAIRFYPLNAVNANGFLFTLDDLIGDEKWRGRYIRFCLDKKDFVLCGSQIAPVMLLSDGDRADPTVFIKDIIETIEFVDYEK